MTSMTDKGIYDYHSLKKLIQEGNDLESIMFKVEALAYQISDENVRKLCDIYQKQFGKLVESNNLFVYIHNLNEKIIKTVEIPYQFTNAVITNARYAFSVVNGFYLQIECDWLMDNSGGSAHPIYSQKLIRELFMQGDYDDAELTLGIGEEDLDKLQGNLVKVGYNHRDDPIIIGVVKD